MAGNDAVEDLRGLRITSLDDDDEEEEEQEEIAIGDDDEEEANDCVVLGFVKKPKNSRSLLRHFFPSKAGGLPVCYRKSLAFCFFEIVFVNFLLNLLIFCGFLRLGWIL